MTYQNPYQRNNSSRQGGQPGFNPQPNPGMDPRFNPGMQPARQPAGGRRPRLRDSHHYTRSERINTGLMLATAYLVIIWSVHIVNTFFFGGTLNYFGIHPLDFSGIWGIFTAPFLHGDFSHLISNSIPGAIFCFLIGLSGKKAFLEVTIIVMLVAGVGTWLLGGPGTNHIGASGLVYGWLAYLIVRGIFNRSLLQTILGIILGVAYSGLIWGVLPLVEGVSWQGHLFGAIGGILAGMAITSDDTLAQLQRREQFKRPQQPNPPRGRY